MPNDLTAVADILISEAVALLRRNSIMPLMVWRDLDGAAAEKNKRIDVKVYNDLAVQDVTAGTPNTPSDITPRVIPVTLTNWKEVRFKMSDLEMSQVEVGNVLPRVVERGVKAHADAIDLFILEAMNLGAGAGVIDVGASVAIADLVNAGKLLDQDAVPNGGRHMVVGSQAKADILTLATFHEADKKGDGGTALREGSVGQAFGFDVVLDQNVDSVSEFVEGTAANYTIDEALDYAAGTREIHVDAGTGTFLPGDIIDIAGVTGTYVIMVGFAGDGDGDITIDPPLRDLAADGAAVTRATLTQTPGTQGFAFDELGYVFATRPLQTQIVPGVVMSQSTDAISGLSMRVTAEYIAKEVIWSMDLLYGGALIEPGRIVKLYT